MSRGYPCSESHIFEEHQSIKFIFEEVIDLIQTCPKTPRSVVWSLPVTPK